MALLSELAVSRRALAVAFLALSAVMTLGGWLRPPLSPDISGLHIPLGLVKDTTTTPEQMLARTNGIPPDSAGLLFLAVHVAGLLIVLLRPQLFAGVAGLLLTALMGINCAVVLNHPALMEVMGFEYTQRQGLAVNEARQEIVSDLANTVREEDLQARFDILFEEYEKNYPFVATTENGRVRVPEPARNADWSDALQGRVYLLYDLWLIPLTIIALLVADRGPLRRRIAHLSLWTVLGVGLIWLFCGDRLRAEYHYILARHRENACDIDGARAELKQAIALFPEFEQLRRTRFLRGKLDYRQHHDSYDHEMYRLHQLVINNEQHLAIGQMGRLLADKRYQDDKVLLQQAAQVWADAGTDAFRATLPMAAYEAFERAAVLDPNRMECALYLTMLDARVDRSRPETAERKFLPISERLDDRMLKADLLARLGDAFFEAGRMEEARKYYQWSLDVWSVLPKVVNHRAEKGLGGM
jgi:tetratricopeptide (TPR) repeat protein